MNRILASVAVAMIVAGPAAAQERRLIWSDEFDGANLDEARWSAVADCWGGGNQERQCYTARPANLAVTNGELRITARPDGAAGPARPQRLGGGAEVRFRPYTSAKVETRGKASFRYGRIEVRARLPEGQGLWPAIWMLPEHDNYGPYPQSGEIDIAEAVNLGVPCVVCLRRREDRIHGTLHHGRNVGDVRQDGRTTALPAPGEFHVFALDWTPREMTWSVDGEPYFRTATRKPFDERFHLILNLAVGGRWPEAQNRGGVDPNALPATLAVDWVRIYE